MSGGLYLSSSIYTLASASLDSWKLLSYLAFWLQFFFELSVASHLPIKYFLGRVPRVSFCYLPHKTPGQYGTPCLLDLSSPISSLTVVQASPVCTHMCGSAEFYLYCGWGVGTGWAGQVGHEEQGRWWGHLDSYPCSEPCCQFGIAQAWEGLWQIQAEQKAIVWTHCLLKGVPAWRLYGGRETWWLSFG